MAAVESAMLAAAQALREPGAAMQAVDTRSPAAADTLWLAAAADSTVVVAVVDSMVEAVAVGSTVAVVAATVVVVDTGKPERNEAGNGWRVRQPFLISR
jgi:hypothetical protein